MAQVRPRRVSAGGTHATNPQWSGATLRFNASGRSWTIDPASQQEPVDAGPATGGGGGRGGRAGGGGDQRLTSPDGRVDRRRALGATAGAGAGGSERTSRNATRNGSRACSSTGSTSSATARRSRRLTTPTRTSARRRKSSSCPAKANVNSRAWVFAPGGTNWNGAGTALAFTADSQYRNERSYGAPQVWTVSTDGVARRLTTDGDHEHNGALFSPDGRWILSTHQISTDVVIAKKMNHGGATDLVLIPAAGGAERVLTANWDYLPTNPRWSPDSRYVYFGGGVGGTTHVFRVNATGGEVEQVTKGERRVSAPSFDRAMTKMAFTVGRIEGPAEIHVADIDGNNERQLTRVHEPFTSSVALGRGERVRYASKDGTMIEGWLIAPNGYRAGTGPYPLVVNSHGGPHSAVGYSFDFKNQYLAANGYFVLTVNFRSSTGYGEKFLWGTWGAWGDKDGEDVMAGVDYAISRYPIDRNRVATIGHSYGGFMSNWLIVKYPGAFRRRGGWRGNRELGERLRHRGHRGHEGDRVLRLSVGRGGAEHHDPPVTADVRGKGKGRDVVHPR